MQRVAHSNKLAALEARRNEDKATDRAGKVKSFQANKKPTVTSNEGIHFIIWNKMIVNQRRVPTDNFVEYPIADFVVDSVGQLS